MSTLTDRHVFLLLKLGELTRLWSSNVLDAEQQARCWQVIEGILLHLEDTRPAFEAAMQKGDDA